MIAVVMILYCTWNGLPYSPKSKILLFFRNLFIYERHREREAETKVREKQAPCPDSRNTPEPKAEAQPLSHPSVFKV